MDTVEMVGDRELMSLEVGLGVVNCASWNFLHALLKYRMIYRFSLNAKKELSCSRPTIISQKIKQLMV